MEITVEETNNSVENKLKIKYIVNISYIGDPKESLIDPIKSGSSLEVGKVFEGEYIPYGSLNGSISYTDTNGTDWLFYPGQTCEILPDSNIL